MKSTGYFSLVNLPPEYSPCKNQSIFTDPNDNDGKKTIVQNAHDFKISPNKNTPPYSMSKNAMYTNKWL